MGQVCSTGKCGYSCSSGETLCGLPPEGGSGMDATGGTETGAKDATGGGDTGASEAGPVDSGGGTTDAGGPTTPYCANTGNDPNNCGACGNVCPPMYVCNGGTCELMCGAGTVACVTSGTCIPSGTCCSTGDCNISGQICDKPGGTCACPGGERECTVTNSCISTNSCCKAADCTVSGSTCSMPGQACTCSMTGYKACLAFNACLPDADCCVPGDCSAPSVADYNCTPSGTPPTSSTCGIKDCKAGCYDLNGQYSDGCECCDDTLAKTCGAPTGLGQLGVGQTVTQTGQAPAAGESDWLQVTFSGEGNKAFHAHITLTTNPNGEYAFDLDSDCTPTPIACAEGGGCTSKTDWEVFYGAQATGNPGDPNWQPISPIGTLLIRVYRVAGNPSCDQWTLTVSE
jgi:hypothetical protein